MLRKPSACLTGGQAAEGLGAAGGFGVDGAGVEGGALRAQLALLLSGSASPVPSPCLPGSLSVALRGAVEGSLGPPAPSAPNTCQDFSPARPASYPGRLRAPVTLTHAPPPLSAPVSSCSWDV